MDLALIKKNSPEWEYLWNWLASHPINVGLEAPSVALNEGEAWEYMGSFKQGDRMIHSLRHRCHPKHGQRMDLHVQASDEFVEDDIHKTLKLK